MSRVKSFDESRFVYFFPSLFAIAACPKFIKDHTFHPELTVRPSSTLPPEIFHNGHYAAKEITILNARVSKAFLRARAPLILACCGYYRLRSHRPNRS